MPISASPSTSRRLLALLSLLQSRRDWPAPVLARRLEVSERTVRRDIDRLRELDYTIDATRGPDGGYRLQAGSQLPPLRFDDDQAVAVTLALRTAGVLGADLDEAAERALGTISRLLPSHLAHRIEGLSSTSAAVSPRGTRTDPAVLVRIGEAIRAQEELRFDYASPIASGATTAGDAPAGDVPGGEVPGGDAKSDDAPEPRTARTGTTAPVRTTEPHHLVLHGGRWYLIGYTAEKDDWRVYRVDRISPRSHTGRRFTPRVVPGGDPARFLSARFTGSSGEDTWACWGEATLRAALADVAPFVGDGTVHELAPGLSRVRLGSWSWGGLASAFSRWEADMSDIEPIELRDAFARLSERASAAASGAGIRITQPPRLAGR